jgi:uncharacterized protein
MRMLSAAELSLLLRQSSYCPRSPWGPFEAFAVTALIYLVCTLLLPLSVYLLSPDVFGVLSKQLGPPKFGYSDYPVIFLIGQIATTVLVLIAAGMRGGSRSKVLSLGPAKGGFLTAVMLASSAFLIIRFIEFIVTLFVLPTPIFYQLTQQASLIQPFWLRVSEPWIKFTIWIIGAPVSEELLFRGFLLSALAKSRAGFWRAAVISNIAWTSTHLSLGWIAILIVFVFGLLLSFILSRTGSIRPCILAHALGNASQAVFWLII